MSRLAFAPSAAGIGVFTITAPSTDTNQTATLPDISGTMVLVNSVTSTVDINGTVLPTATNTHDLGSSSLRWRNIYTQDLHLSNGVGDYTVIEGEEDLFIVNNKSGKSFKFALIEVDPSTVPPKSEV